MIFFSHEATFYTIFVFLFFTVDDKFTFDEFVMIMETYEKIQVEGMMLQTFQIVDIDGDGFISAQELHAAMSDMGENVTEEEIQTMITLADLDLDGKINFEGKLSNQHDLHAYKSYEKSNIREKNYFHVNIQYFNGICSILGIGVLISNMKGRIYLAS